MLLNFLSTFLRDEGGYEFKLQLTECILSLIQRIPEAKEVGLLHLCEFIEDCEFTSLSVKILYVLGQIGPYTSRPSKYVRFIYNRVILENAQVRASALATLMVFAVEIESLRPNVVRLMERCMEDEDDEVRDRATVYLDMISGGRFLCCVVDLLFKLCSLNIEFIYGILNCDYEY